MSGEYSYNSVKIKLEKLSEVERSTIQNSTNTDTDVDTEVEVLPTPEKVNLVVSIDDDEGPSGPGHVDSSATDTDKDNNNDMVNQIENEKEVDVTAGPSNKRQKLMIKKPSSSSGTCHDSSNREVSSCSTLDLNDLNSSPLQMLAQDGNSSLTVGSRPANNNASSSANDKNIDEFVRGSPMDILKPCSSSSILIVTPITNDPNDNSQYDVKVVDGKIVFDVKNQEELNKKIESLVKLSDTSLVKIIEIQSDPEDNLYIGYKQFKALSTMSFPQLEKLHIGLNFHESITAKLFEDLLINFSENLIHFHVTGGYIGIKKEEFVLRIPPLPELEHFAFQSFYSFDTSIEVIEPAKIVQDGHVELIVIDDQDDEIPQKEAETPTKNELFRITIFLPKLKYLKEIVFGNYIKVITSDPLKSTEDEEFSFENYKQLEIFKVGSPWNNVVHFLPPKYYQVVLKEIQFPDFLKDLTVIRKIAEIFPNLEIVHLNHPSPFILQKFIQIFSTLDIKKLFLKTSFLFEDTDGKILCGLYRAKEGEEERKIPWFGSHGNLDDFEKELEKNQKGKQKKKTTPPKIPGLGSLKTLENFQFLHFPRKIYFPKFKKTIGFDHYTTGFPGLGHVSNFIQELRMLTNLNDFLFPSWFSEGFEKYLTERFGELMDGSDEIYPKLLKVNKTENDGGKKVKSEVKQENQTS